MTTTRLLAGTATAVLALTFALTACASWPAATYQSAPVRPAATQPATTTTPSDTSSPADTGALGTGPPCVVVSCDVPPPLATPAVYPDSFDTIFMADLAKTGVTGGKALCLLHWFEARYPTALDFAALGTPEHAPELEADMNAASLECAYS